MDRSKELFVILYSILAKLSDDMFFFIYCISYAKYEFGQNPEENIILTGSLTKTNRENINVNYNTSIYLYTPSTTIRIFFHARFFLGWPSTTAAFSFSSKSSMSVKFKEVNKYLWSLLIRHYRYNLEAPFGRFVNIALGFLVYGFSCHFQQYFSYIVAVSFIGKGNRSTGREPLTCFLWT